MKPQLIEAGYHNKDLQKNTLGFIRGGSWEKQRTKEQQKRWYARNSEKKKLYVRQYYAAHRDERIRWAKQYRIEKPWKTLESQLRRSYGLTVGELEAILAKQNNQCAICGVVFDKKTKNRKPHIDHCHSSGVVRGVLCNLCNISLGHIEKPGFLDLAKRYLGLQ